MRLISEHALTSLPRSEGLCECVETPHSHVTSPPLGYIVN